MLSFQSTIQTTTTNQKWQSLWHASRDSVASDRWRRSWDSFKVGPDNSRSECWKKHRFSSRVTESSTLAESLPFPKCVCVFVPQLFQSSMHSLATTQQKNYGAASATRLGPTRPWGNASQRWWAVKRRCLWTSWTSWLKGSHRKVRTLEGHRNQQDSKKWNQICKLFKNRL